MSDSYSKNYFEKYVALTLSSFLDIIEDHIILSDRPDLRIPSLYFGIEVTQALTQQEAVADIKKPLYASLDMNPFDQNNENIEFVMKKIHNAIERKIEKSKNYEVYSHNGLYIFSHCHNLEEHILLSYFHNHQIEYYRYIYINCVTKVYCFDYQLNKMSSIHFHRSELIAMNIHSLIYEKTCSKERRKIIVGNE